MSHFEGILHKYNSNNVAFEFSPTQLPKVLIVIGGMTDGLLTVPYFSNLPKLMEPLDYSVVQIQLTSSYKGWGTTSLHQDTKEIVELIEYLKSPEGGNRTKIVILGHSTGSQDVMLTLLTHSSIIDAGIMQGCVSDREAFTLDASIGTIEKLTQQAKKLCDEGKGQQLLSHEYSKYVFNTPITAYRWCSLLIPEGDDDYFSSDLSKENLQRSFGQIKKPFLIAYSEKDEFVPSYVDKLKVINNWREVSNPQCWSKYSGLVKGANHGVSNEKSQEHLFEMIGGFFNEFNL